MGPIASIFGVGDASTPDVGAAGGQASALIQQLIQMLPASYNAQATYGPQFAALTGSEVGATVPTLSDLISQYLPGINTSINAANAGAAGSAVGNATNLGPGAAAAIKAVNPAGSADLSALLDTTTSGLKAGTTLAPQDTANITRTVNDNWANRGLDASGPASLDEALNLYAGGQNALAQRESAAGSAIGTGTSALTLPGLALTQTPSSAPGYLNSILGQSENIAGPSGNTLTDPTSILSAAYNANAAANITSANNAAGLNSY